MAYEGLNCTQTFHVDWIGWVNKTCECPSGGAYIFHPWDVKVGATCGYAQPGATAFWPWLGFVVLSLVTLSFILYCLTCVTNDCREQYRDKRLERLRKKAASKRELEARQESMRVYRAALEESRVRKEAAQNASVGIVIVDTPPPVFSDHEDAIPPEYIV